MENLASSIKSGISGINKLSNIDHNGHIRFNSKALGETKVSCYFQDNVVMVENFE